MADYKLVYDDVVKNTRERLILDVVTVQCATMLELNGELNKHKKNYDNVNTIVTFDVDWDNESVTATITRESKLGGVEVKYI